MNLFSRAKRYLWVKLERKSGVNSPNPSKRLVAIGVILLTISVVFLGLMYGISKLVA